MAEHETRVVTATPLRPDGEPRCVLGESPRWDGSRLWWVDASSGGVYRWRADGAVECLLDAGTRVSLVQPATGDRVVVARDTELVILGADGPRTWTHLGLRPGWLANDGVADPLGRLWIGTVAPGSQRLAGTLLRVDPDGQVTEVASGFTVSNGLAWDPSFQYLFHADSAERVVWRHRVDLALGTVVAREPFVELADGMPDGLAADRDGGIWVAVYGAGEVRRYLSSGRLDFVVEIDVPQPTAVAVADGRIFVTTAREGYDDDRSRAEPMAGRLFEAAVPYLGPVRSLVDPRPRQ